MENKSFEDLYNKNVSEFVEKKGKFNYLSWAFAVKELKKAYPEATYIQVYNEQNKPYFTDESGCYIRVKLFLTKQDRKEDFYQDFTHPVLNSSNKTILKPNSFEVNTSFMRGLTKLIGMCTGIGLSLYSGEDLPEVEKEIEVKYEKELPKITVLSEQEIEQKRIAYLEKISKALSELTKDNLISSTAYYEYVKKNITDKKPHLLKDDEFNAIVSNYSPKPENRENLAKQSVNKFDKCNECKNETEFCICDIDKKAPALAKPSGSWAI